MPALESDDPTTKPEGEIGFRSGDREAVLGAGGLHHEAEGRTAHHVERGHHACPHDRGDQPSRLRKLLPRPDRPDDRRRPPFEAIATLAEAFGLQFGERPWLPDLIARYNLTPPG